MKTATDTVENSGVAILDRVIQLDETMLTPEAAQTLLSLRFPRRDERRMNQLAAKARRGRLTASEQNEAEQYNMVSHMVALLQASARRVIGSHDTDSAAS